MKRDEEAEGTMCARIVYVGCGMSGRRTSVAQVLRRSGVEADPLTIRGSSSYEVRWKHEDEILVLHLSISAARSRLYYQDPGVASLDARIREEIDLLRDADGIIFVVDSQAARLPANVDEQEKLHRDLWSRGIDPATKPIVFQINKRDLDDTIPAERVRQELGTDGVYVDSVALHGTGVCEALDALIELLKGRRGR